MGCHALLQGNLPLPEIKSESPASPALASGLFTTCATWEAHRYVLILTETNEVFTREKRSLNLVLVSGGSQVEHRTLGCSEQEVWHLPVGGIRYPMSRGGPK